MMVILMLNFDLTGVPNVDKGHPASPVGLGQDNVHSAYSDSDGGDANIPPKRLRRQSPSPERRDSSADTVEQSDNESESDSDGARDVVNNMQRGHGRGAAGGHGRGAAGGGMVLVAVHLLGHKVQGNARLGSQGLYGMIFFHVL
jgi:hypothetical protein